MIQREKGKAESQYTFQLFWEIRVWRDIIFGTLRMKGEGPKDNTHKAQIRARGNQGRHSLVERRLKDGGGEYIGDTTEAF